MSQDQPKQQTNQQRVDELKRQIQEGEKAGKDVSAMKEELQKLQDQGQSGQSRQTGQQGGGQQGGQRR